MRCHSNIEFHFLNLSWPSVPSHPNPNFPSSCVCIVIAFNGTIGENSEDVCPDAVAVAVRSNLLLVNVDESVWCKERYRFLVMS